MKILLMAWGLFLVNAVSVSAQVIPDNTLLSPSIAPLNCTDCEITGGEILGSNLFHSFEQFSVSTGGRVFFNNAANIQNIFTRITGRSPSTIDGIIQANGTANLFLLNPNGIVFGRNASLNIGGSFFATTGDQITFVDGIQFSAVNPQSRSLLTISTPIGVQMGQNAGAIINRSQASVSNAVNTSGLPVGLQVIPGEAIGLIGNGIFLENGNLTARSGRIELESVTKAQVSLNPFGSSYTLANTNINQLADIRLSDHSNIDASGEEVGSRASGGGIRLRGRTIDVIGESSIASSTYQGIGRDLRFIASDSLTLNTSFIATFNEREGQAGDVIVRVGDSVDLRGNPRGVLGSQARINSIGNAGDIWINTDRLRVRDGFQIEASTLGKGNAGTIQIRTERLEVSGSNREEITVARNSISVGQLPSGIISQVGIRSGNEASDAGNLSINTRQLVLRDGGFISTATFASGNSGNLTINATESIEIRGATPAITRNQYRSGIFVSSEPGENSLGQPISTSGSVGTLQITTDRLTVVDRAEISANNRGTGFAGLTTLNVRDLQIRSGGEIRASSLSSGNGGTLVVNADSIQLRGSGIIGSQRVPSSLAALGRSSGSVGNLEITTSSLDILNGAEVSVSGSGSGGAGEFSGDLFISADRINLDRGRLAASTQAIRGGNISLENVGLLTLNNNSVLSARATNQATDGNITVTAPNGFVLATGENNDIIADAFEGRGGNITIKAQSILGLNERRSTPTNFTNDIDASSEFGAPGSVTINQINPDPSQGAIELPTNIIDASSLVSQACSARGPIARTPGEFTITGRGGLSPSPIQPLNANSVATHWITSTEMSNRSQDAVPHLAEQMLYSAPLIEAQGWIRTTQGEVKLVAETPVFSTALTTQSNCDRPTARRRL
jgi:filamentous hemagglutinin family protein